MKKYYLICIFLIILILPVYSQDNLEDIYYRQILNATFINDKNVIALKLGKLKTEKAKELLLKLFNNESLWTSAGVIEGLLILDDIQIDNIIIEKYFENRAIENYIEKGIYKNFTRFYKIIKNKYYSSKDQKLSEKVFKVS